MQLQQQAMQQPGLTARVDMRGWPLAPLSETMHAYLEEYYGPYYKCTFETRLAVLKDVYAHHHAWWANQSTSSIARIGDLSKSMIQAIHSAANRPIGPFRQDGYSGDRDNDRSSGARSRSRSASKGRPRLPVPKPPRQPGRRQAKADPAGLASLGAGLE